MIIDGIVEGGKRLGRTIGFPTANILVTSEVNLPADGVYIAAVWLDGGEAPWPAMLNQGRHPTVPDGKPTVEAHILNFSGDIYGRSVRIEYLHFLRPEKRFEGLEALKAQLRADRAATHAWALAHADEYLWQGAENRK